MKHCDMAADRPGWGWVMDPREQLDYWLDFSPWFTPESGLTGLVPGRVRVQVSSTATLAGVRILDNPAPALIENNTGIALWFGVIPAMREHMLFVREGISATLYVAADMAPDNIRVHRTLYLRIARR